MRTSDLRVIARGSDELAEKAATRLAVLAEAEGVLDVGFATVESPIGDLLVAVTPRGLVRIAFVDEDRDTVMADMASRLSPRILESASVTDPARRQLDEYFERRRQVFDLPLDRSLIHGIAGDVLKETGRIPFGETSSYGEIARKIGRPRAARAVGNALGSNPIPIVIPCHRVLRAGGGLGGYGGGVDRKQTLLAIEGTVPQ